MKHVQLEKPCSEDWNQMNSTQKGATEVIDFTNKTTVEIKSIFKEFSGQSMCGRISDHQLLTLNREFENWKKLNSKASFQSIFLFAMLIVFGLSLFSCETEKDRKTITKIQKIFSKVELIPSDNENSKQVTPIVKMETITPIKHIIQKNNTINELVEITKNMEEITIEDDLEEKTITVYAGGMRWSEAYTTFLTESPVSPEILYDENGEIIPTTFTSKLFPNPVITSTTFEIGLPENDLFVIQQ